MNEDKKDLKYYENNAKEDYIKTPISVLRYINELESKVNNNCDKQNAIESSKCEHDWSINQNDKTEKMCLKCGLWSKV